MQDFWKEFCGGIGVLFLYGIGAAALVGIGYWLGSR